MGHTTTILTKQQYFSELRLDTFYSKSHSETPPIHESSPLCTATTSFRRNRRRLEDEEAERREGGAEEKQEASVEPRVDYINV